MVNKNQLVELSEQYVVPVTFTIVLIIILAAVFTGNSYEDELEANRIIRKDGKVTKKDWFSVEVINLNKKNARYWGISADKKGVIVTEVEGIRDVKMKLHAGDVISGINGKEIKSVRDFRKASNEFNPAAGLFLDIDRYGYPLFVSIPGSNYSSNAQFMQTQTPDPYRITGLASGFGSDFNIGAVQAPVGIVGQQFENWINHNFKGQYHSCLNCGTMVPHSGATKNNNIFCPNCGNRMGIK